ncbi:hypothetical protein [Rothia mucilaginosa]|uniref:hypothetical protein n=1 Tax=Rothia mucilaginosa TaxID=43675 RepID=UPI0028DD2807|nr:hypothetical protein [Rothia mucilaginosa]
MLLKREEAGLCCARWGTEKKTRKNGGGALLFPTFFGAVAVWLIALVLLLAGLVFVGDFFVSRRTKSTVHISPDGVIDVEAK